MNIITRSAILYGNLVWSSIKQAIFCTADLEEILENYFSNIWTDLKYRKNIVVLVLTTGAYFPIPASKISCVMRQLATVQFCRININGGSK